MKYMLIIVLLLHSFAVMGGRKKGIQQKKSFKESYFNVKVYTDQFEQINNQIQKGLYKNRNKTTSCRSRGSVKRAGDFWEKAYHAQKQHDKAKVFKNILKYFLIRKCIKQKLEYKKSKILAANQDNAVGRIITDNWQQGSFNNPNKLDAIDCDGQVAFGFFSERDYPEQSTFMWQQGNEAMVFRLNNDLDQDKLLQFSNPYRQRKPKEPKVLTEASFEKLKPGRSQRVVNKRNAAKWSDEKLSRTKRIKFNGIGSDEEWLPSDDSEINNFGTDIKDPIKSPSCNSLEDDTGMLNNFENDFDTYAGIESSIIPIQDMQKDLSPLNDPVGSPSFNDLRGDTGLFNDLEGWLDLQEVVTLESSTENDWIDNVLN